jgi:ribosomal protein S18 acetylase RimI-like enzyme
LTYSILARNVGATKISTRAFQGYTSAIPHAIGNFAIDLRLDSAVVRSLARLASEHSHFQIYHLPTDEPEYVRDLLTNGGFAETYGLELFGTLDPQPLGLHEGDPKLEIIESKEQHARLRTMEFIAAEFLPGNQRPTQHWMVEATAKARELELFNLMVEGNWIGGFMLAEFGDGIGLYNLCIKARYRRRGYGRSAMNFFLGRAKEREKHAILQSDPTLSNWYDQLGLIKLGRMQTYSFQELSSPL